MARKKFLTNAQLLTKFMEESRTGPLAQCFVICGLEEYAKQVAADTSKWPETSMVSQEAWKACAEEFLALLKARK
jgi:hypothetical protein